MKTKRQKFKRQPSDNRKRQAEPANKNAIIKQIEVVAEPLCESEGLELVHVEFQRESGGRILRLYIDRSSGVSLDDCVNISRQLNDLLDVNLDDIGPYTLEVTSPGPERPLSKLKDYERFKGRKAKIKTQQPIDEQKNFTGVIVGTSGEQIKLSLNDKIVDIPFDDIARGRLVDANGEI
ncbi:MAG: ribosome maturation factor RimP [Desulfobacterales bacterium]|nr:ribosome maturation factor RimP [Desulfobacterales bacterium]